MLNQHTLLSGIQTWNHEILISRGYTVLSFKNESIACFNHMLCFPTIVSKNLSHTGVKMYLHVCRKVLNLLKYCHMIMFVMSNDLDNQKISDFLVTCTIFTCHLVRLPAGKSHVCYKIWNFVNFDHHRYFNENIVGKR